jgi:hypothetical protein
MNAQQQARTRLFAVLAISFGFLFLAYHLWYGTNFFASYVEPTPDADGLVSVRAAGEASLANNALEWAAIAVTWLGSTAIALTLGAARFLVRWLEPLMASEDPPVENDKEAAAGMARHSHPDAEYENWLKAREESKAREEALAATLATQKAVDLDRLYNAIQNGNKNLVVGLCEDLAGTNFMSGTRGKAKPKAKPKKQPNPNVASFE